ncbi:hypothetical protein PGQ11_011062 [Apiospora arundinis]|uniref:Uncharacterized protein n=1 Tax=Apiospora arundinis TaxID=335852 RepID=A0ABR2HYG5_9PEZI
MGNNPSCHEARLLPQPHDLCSSPGPSHLLTLGLDRRPAAVSGACRPNLGGVFEARVSYNDTRGVLRRNIPSASNPVTVADGAAERVDFVFDAVRYRDLLPRSPVEVTITFDTKAGHGERTHDFYFQGEPVKVKVRADDASLGDTATQGEEVVASEVDARASNAYPICHL